MREFHKLHEKKMKYIEVYLGTKNMTSMHNFFMICVFHELSEHLPSRECSVKAWGLLG